MSIVQFINALQQYSVDVLFLALFVCLATSILKKIIPPLYKKYLTFAPFVIGCICYAVYMYVTEKSCNLFAEQTLLKGLQIGAAATIYYVLFEQFIRGKKSLLGMSNTKELTVAGLLKEMVSENYLYSVSVNIVRQVSHNLNDAPYCIAFCITALNGKTLPGISEQDITAAARLIISTLSVI